RTTTGAAAAGAHSAAVDQTRHHRDDDRNSKDSHGPSDTPPGQGGTWHHRPFMRLLYVTSEMAPFAKTGGLADVLGALPVQLHRMGHEVRVFLPAYASIDRSKYPLSA